MLKLNFLHDIYDKKTSLYNMLDFVPTWQYPFKNNRPYKVTQIDWESRSEIVVHSKLQI